MDFTNRLNNCHKALSSGDVKSAESQYQALLVIDPSLGDAHHLGALIAEKAGRPDIAIKRINLAIAGQSGHYEYLNTKGNILKNTQDDPGAIKAYQAGLAARPSYLGRSAKPRKTPY